MEERNGFFGNCGVRILAKKRVEWPSSSRFNQTAVALFGSLKNMAQRLLESLRYRCWEEEAFDAAVAATIQIRLNSS